MSMATGVEVRVPFLDQELIEFASKIPDRYNKIRSREMDLKKVMEKSSKKFNLSKKDWLWSPSKKMD